MRQPVSGLTPHPDLMRSEGSFRRRVPDPLCRVRLRISGLTSGPTGEKAMYKSEHPRGAGPGTLYKTEETGDHGPGDGPGDGPSHGPGQGLPRLGLSSRLRHSKSSPHPPGPVRHMVRRVGSGGSIGQPVRWSRGQCLTLSRAASPSGQMRHAHRDHGLSRPRDHGPPKTAAAPDSGRLSARSAIFCWA